MSQSVSPVYITVSYSDGGASGGGVWGSITGTLSNQTDLQSALDAKLDESTIDGGTEGQILSKASATDFDFAWINNYAKYLATNVRNQTGSTIGAFQVVYISGATGNKPLISLADADTEATSSKTYGVTATSIANNGTGDVVTAGELSGIDTSAFNEGDLLWLSTTAGGVVTSPPTEPAHAVFIGYVVRSHPTLGTIDVSIQNGYELNELHGVQITTPTDNQGLFYNATSTLWENKSITTALGYTPVPTTRNITINGVTYDLSADRTYTISAGISGSGASGQVTYWTGASAVSGSNNLFWDNANGRLGIGTNTPTKTLVLSKSFGADDGIVISDTSGGYFQVTNSSSSLFQPVFQGQARGNASSLIFKGLQTATVSPTATVTRFISRAGDDSSAVSGVNPFTFENGTSTILALTQSNNLILQNGGTFIDGGQRLQVQGTTLLNGNVTFSSATGMFWDATNSRLGIGTNAPAYLLEVLKNQNTQTSIAVTNTTIGTSASAAVKVFANNGQIDLVKYSTGRTPYKIIGAGDGAIYNYSVTANSDIAILNEDVGGRIKFGAGSASTSQMTLFANGNLAINSGVTDLGTRLGVIGDTLLRGSGATSATTALTVQNSSSTNLFTVRNDGNVGIGVASSSYPLDVNNTGTSATFNVTARFLQLSTQNGTGAFASGSGLSYRPQGNQSAQVLTWGVNTGQNIGGSYLASNGNTNIAGWFSATVDKNSAANIGIASFAVNNGTSPTQVAGYFALAEYGTSLPTFTNAAIVADNGATTSPIFIGRDNGSTVFTIADGGNIGIGNTPTAAIDIKASTTTAAAMRFRSGTAPTTPNDGDIWFDGTDIKMRIGGVTKTFTLI
jgi:hypothetical protein